MDVATGFFLLLVLFFSFMLRNLTYGYVAGMLGDPTARLSGRLTANPLNHLDMLGSVIIPGLLIFSSTGIIIGWPKPVPYNKYNFTNQKWGETILGLAGSGTNLVLAIIFALLIRFSPIMANASFVDFAIDVVILNLFLALFNLLPIPPLDGAKILANILPTDLSFKFNNFIRAIEARPFLSLLLILVVFTLFLGTAFFTIVLYGTAFLTDLSVGTVLSLYR